MNLTTPFINENGRLRSGWRFLIFVLLFIAFIMGSDALLFFVRFSTLPHGDYVSEVVHRTFLIVCALLAGFLTARFIEGLPWRSLGLCFHRRWFFDLFMGSLVGLLTLALAVGIAAAAGGLKFSLSGREVMFAVVKSLITSAALFVIAALAEEAMFRGYPLQTFSRAHLVWLGVFITSVPFGLVHLWNPNVVRGVTFANTALAGVWLAIAYLRTRSLWLPLGVHWSWNWALGSVFGLPVSGITIVSQPLLRGKDIGPAWLTGGSYGIEGGVACTVVLVLSTLFLWRTKLLSADPDLLKLTSDENPVKIAPPQRSDML